ncbi:unnamed protein product, partial [Prorocentrum cordatum]
ATPGNPGSSSGGAVEELAQAIHQVIDQSKVTSDSRLKHTVRSIAEITGSAGGPDIVEDSPAFKKLKTDMLALQTEQKSQRGTLVALQQTVENTSGDIKDMKMTLAAALAAPSRAGNPGHHQQGSGGGAQPEARANGEPLFQPEVDAALHSAAAGVLGISADRREMAELGANIGDGAMGFEPWWTSVMKFKTQQQWDAKLQNLSQGAIAPGTATTKEAVGAILYNHVNKDGTWSQHPLWTPART